MSRRRKARSALATSAFGIGCLAALGSGCSKEVLEAAPPVPRAVHAVEQVVRDPSRRLRIAGVAGAWKRETLSLQVGGRIVWVTEPEKSVTGPTIDEAFLPGRDGTVIARVDPERYQSALDAAKASHAAAKARLEATRQQLEEVLPQDEAKAETELKRATDNRDRIRRAVERNAVAGTDLTNAEAAVKTAQANLESVRGRLRAQRSELAGLKAQVDQAEQAERSAALDLRDTELRAPFTGRITQVHVVPGALVQPGTPIAELVMMDPIKIDVTVATSTAREIGNQDQGQVFTEGDDEPLIANLYQRDSITDSATRTVRLTLICRNPEITAVADGAQVVEDVIPLIEFPVGDRRAWFIERRCVKQDDSGTFAWRVIAEDLRQVTGEVIDLQRMPIELGEARKDFVGLYQFFEVVPSADMRPLLAEVEGLTVKKLMFGLGVPNEFSGGKAMIVRQDWRMRPGDVVEVQLALDSAGAGVYVPASAIGHEGEQAFVYLVRDRGGEQVLERADVTISGRVGADVRIADDLIGEGAPIVEGGTHVLEPGARVQTVAVKPAR
ncbi:MAG: HlyD family efflux transporter periplasmic adaptor subunit [bacterium]|nr:HlyD family efflux transporter periplasmic adaptor subunit [bacterium]